MTSRDLFKITFDPIYLLRPKVRVRKRKARRKKK